MRGRLKRALVAGYCAGALPAWVVKVSFRLFDLKGA